MTSKLFHPSSYHYDFDPDLIAQYPLTPRDSSRLMVVERSTGAITETTFKEIIRFLNPDDTMIFNNTKVIPSRLIGRRENGGKSEIFLLRKLENGTWIVLAKPGKKLKVGAKVFFSEQFHCEVTDILEDGSRIAAFFHPGSFEEQLIVHGQVPLPQYIKREADKALDGERYQTVYAVHSGAAAAPTAGLHFTAPLLEEIKNKGIAQEYVTLHVGLGTFKPVQVEDDIRKHQMHSEACVIDAVTANRLNSRKGSGRKISVGTTSCRVLESFANEEGLLTPGMRDTDIFIYSGYRFKCVDALLTNFHLPGSTLLMLVSAFAGYDLIMEAYRIAVSKRYRLFSYGDAMLIL